jgi:AcrR family transcriptional regulator
VNATRYSDWLSRPTVDGRANGLDSGTDLRSVIRTQPVRQERREELLKQLSTAVERLLERGVSYAEISVERLCEEAGTSRATFYQYFEDKAELLTTLAEAALHDLGDTTEFWWHLPPGSDKADLRAAFARTFALYREHHGVMRSLSETAAHDTAMRERLRGIVRWAIDETASHIEAGIAARTINPAVNPDLTAQWLCWMFERGLYEIAGDPDEQALDAMLDAITGLIWNALYRDAR